MNINEISDWILDHPTIFFGFYLVLLPTIAVVIFAALIKIAKKADK